MVGTERRRGTTPGRRLLAVGLVLVITLVAFEVMSVATVMPLVEDDLGELWLYGWVFSAFFLGSLIGVVLAASATDRMAPWIPLAVGLVVFTAGLLVGGLATSMGVLVAGRGLQGIGAGTMPAIAFVCVGRSFPEDERARMLAWMSSAWMIPSVAGPLLAAWIGEAFGWRWVFLGLLPLCLLFGALAVFGVRHVPAPHDGEAAPHNVGPAFTVAMGAGVLLAGLSASRWWLLLVGVAVGAVVLVPAYRRLTPAGTLRAVAGLPATVAVRGLLSAGFHAVDAYVPFVVTTVRGASALLGGAALLVGSATWTMASWLQVRWQVRFGTVALVRSGLLGIASGVVLMLAVLSPVVPVGVALVAWGVAGFGIGLAWAPLMQGALGGADPGREGAITTSMQLSDMLGTALATGIVGAIVAATVRSSDREVPGLLIGFMLAAVVSLAGAVLATRVRADRRRAGVETGLDDAQRH